MIAFLQEKAQVVALERNITELSAINETMQSRAYLARTNTEYIRMNAHRVGLVSEDEYFIKTADQLFNTAVSYTPGKIIPEKDVFFLTPRLLFFISLTIYFLLYAVQIMLARKELSLRQYRIDANQRLRSQASM